MFVPQIFIDLDECLNEQVMNVGKKATYTTWEWPRYVEVFMNLDTFAYNADFYKSWQFYYYSTKVVVGFTYMMLFVFNDPTTAIINGIRVFTDSYRLAYQFITY